MDDLLIGLFEEWRAEIDAVPFTYEAECDKVVHVLLGYHGYPAAEPVGTYLAVVEPPLTLDGLPKSDEVGPAKAL